MLRNHVAKLGHGVAAVVGALLGVFQALVERLGVAHGGLPELVEHVGHVGLGDLSADVLLLSRPLDDGVSGGVDLLARDLLDVAAQADVGEAVGARMVVHGLQLLR